MTAQTVSGAVAVRDKQNQLIEWVRGQQADIAMAAATHIKPSAIIRVTQGALRRNDKLLAAAIANPQSLLYALLDCARLGHEPDTDDYYLVPFGNEVTGIEGYKGIIERMYRAGAVSSVVAEVVYQRDIYRRAGPTTPPVHEFDEFADPDERGPLRGAYAYAVMLDGRFSKVIAMGRAEVMKHKAKSRGSHKEDSPWRQWEEAMWKKCPLRGLEAYVPTSSEYRTARPAPAVFAAPTPLQAPSAASRALAVAEPVDGEIVDDEPATPHLAAAPQPPREPKPASEAAMRRMDDLIRQLDLGPDEDIAALIHWITGTDGSGIFTTAHADNVTSLLKDALKAAGGDTDKAAAEIWAQYKRMNPQAGDEGA